MVYTWDKANADAPTRHTTQYFEMLGNRAISDLGEELYLRCWFRGRCRRLFLLQFVNRFYG